MHFARLRSIASAFFLLTFLACLFLAPNLRAQSPSTGALTGAVKDTTGAVVPNATVTATNVGTGQTRTTTTGGDGSYTLGLLPPGTYKVKFEATGFKPSGIARGHRNRDPDGQPGSNAGSRIADPGSYGAGQRRDHPDGERHGRIDDRRPDGYRPSLGQRATTRTF